MMRDSRGQMGQRRESREQTGPRSSMFARAGPVEVVHQLAVQIGRRNANIMEQAGFKCRGLALLRPADCLRNICGHDADPLAVIDVVDTDQIQCIGKCIDDAAEVDTYCWHGALQGDRDRGYFPAGYCAMMPTDHD
jgi:hypothetical protein